MSDPTTSGGTPAAPAAAPTETAVLPPTGAFGTSRGTGLARGKRPGPPAAKPASTTPAGYQPSSIEVIRPRSEYKNPFTGETSVGAPAVNEPAPQAAPPPAPVPPVTAFVAPKPAPVAPPPRPDPVKANAAPMGEMFPFVAPDAPAARPVTAPVAGSVEKPRLNILPPEDVRRSAQSWESAGSPAPTAGERANDRPIFRPEGHPQRDNRRADSAPRPSDSHPPAPRREAAKLDASSPPVPEDVTSGGFFSWLKGLFGGGKPKEKSSASRDGHTDHGHHSSSHTDDHRRDDGGQHRRHRGGRGRHDGSRGEGSHGGEGTHRSESDFGSAGGESSGSSHGGSRSGEPRSGGGRRRRGGRGRSRGEGGGYPRQEEGHRHSGGGSGLAPPPSS